MDNVSALYGVGGLHHGFRMAFRIPDTFSWVIVLALLVVVTWVS
jgi:hypothetical protein